MITKTGDQRLWPNKPMKMLLSCCLLLSFIVLGSGFKEKPKPEKIYSCYPAINTYVTDHIKDFRHITFEQLATYRFIEQKAIYNTLPKQKQKSIWRDRLIKASLSNKFNDEQKRYIINLADKLRNENDTRTSDEVKAEILSLFTKEQANHTFANLSDAPGVVVFAGICPDCAPQTCQCCMQDDYCMDACVRSITHPCSSTPSGCGYLWHSPCNGLCTGGG